MCLWFLCVLCVSVRSVLNPRGRVVVAFVLAKKLTLPDQPNSHLPLFRMQWHSLSISVAQAGGNPNAAIPRSLLRAKVMDIRSFRASTKLTEGPAFVRLFRIGSYIRSRANFSEMSTSKTNEFKSPAMNTCKKIGVGVRSFYSRRFPR